MRHFSITTAFLLGLQLCWSLSVRYRARVAYDGAGFQGFQLQESGVRTIQGDLEAVLSQRLNEHVRVVGAGRTDAGVHARGQAIHFNLEQDLTLQQLQEIQVSLDRMLPPDLAVWNVQKVPDRIRKLIDGKVMDLEWNVIYDNTKKLYSYRLSTAPVMDPIHRHHRWHPDSVERWLDLEQLRRLLKLYEGTHDFRPFAGAIEQLEKRSGRQVDTVRTVYKVDLVKEEGDGNYRIDILLKGALYKQVRNMVGTVLDVGRGRKSEQDFRYLLGIGVNGMSKPLTRDDNRSKPAPPQGLTLEHVYFDDEDF